MLGLGFVMLGNGGAELFPEASSMPKIPYSDTTPAQG